MIDLDGLEVGGYSVGGFASCLDIPAFKLAVDLGICLDRVVSRDTVLVTHAHVDHLGALAQHAAQRSLRGLRPATYVVPPEIQDGLDEVLAPWRKLDRGDLAIRVQPLAPGERFAVRRDLSVRPFRTKHRVVSQGYLIERAATRLKDEYVGLGQDELRTLRQEGNDLNVLEHRLELAVTGDTEMSAVLANEEVLAARRLVMECTFLDDRIDVEGARSRGHVHLEEVVEAALAGRIGAQALLLNHVSPRHSRDAAERLLRERLPADLLARTQLMMGQV